MVIQRTAVTLNTDSSSPGRITYSKSSSDDEESWWDLRMARHAEFMKLAVEKL